MTPFPGAPHGTRERRLEAAPGNNTNTLRHMAKKPKHIIVTHTITLIVTVGDTSKQTIDQQRHELECNVQALFDHGFENGRLTKDTDCGFVNCEESTTSIAL